MSSNNTIPDFERPLLFDGQRLTAANLEAVEDYKRQLRWLHNRSLHTWGIVFGLEVTGARDDREVTVQPGFALDCMGRELVVNNLVKLPIPPVAGINGQPAMYYLSISFLEDEQLTPSETESGVCDTNGAVRLPEEARLRFQSVHDNDPSTAYLDGEDVILASIKVQNCKLFEPPWPRERRDARLPNRPYVATGLVNAAFRLSTKSTVGMILEMNVDTSASGFNSTPIYIAQVVGKRILSIDVLNNSPKGPKTREKIDVLVDGSTNIVSATSTGFTLQMYFPTGLYAGKTPLNPTKPGFELIIKAIYKSKWEVAWMGIEG